MKEWITLIFLLCFLLFGFILSGAGLGHIFRGEVGVHAYIATGLGGLFLISAMILVFVIFKRMNKEDSSQD